MARVVRVVAGVATDGEAVLACRRSPERSSGGKWEFPGGKIEADETPEVALRRELREELDAETSVGALLDRSVVAVGGLTIDLACYAVSFERGTPTRSTDHDELRWVHRSELTGLDWAEPDLPMVRLLTAG
ncbi:(deoxy)nucleoside triphosphate pyrophosphohydrolase [Plantibacter flavus]|uniref:(deoxy)nucleoside triphosphate pyrophosphohydrolase n=1 Tax=Plantibacter flavus TaxID=150123 RepID=UPI003F1641E2